MPAILKVAAYRCVELDDRPAVGDRLLQQARVAAREGTVLLAPEGISLMLSPFPAALAAHQAALWMREQGLPHALQLDGGRLEYVELEPGAPHVHGECFVVDEREALDTELKGRV